MRTLKKFMKEEDILPTLGTGLFFGALISVGAAALRPVMAPEAAAHMIASDPDGVRMWISIGVTTALITFIAGVGRAIWGLRPERWRTPASHFDL
jgi:hypothetical protein